MPGFSGLSNQSCERRFLPLGCGVAGSFADAVLPFFFAISSSPGASFRRLWNRLISARECAQVRGEINRASFPSPRLGGRGGGTKGSEPGEGDFPNAPDLTRVPLTPIVSRFSTTRPPPARRAAGRKEQRGKEE